jgi:hypothetical protein
MNGFRKISIQYYLKVIVIQIVSSFPCLHIYIEAEKSHFRGKNVRDEQGRGPALFRNFKVQVCAREFRGSPQVCSKVCQTLSNSRGEFLGGIYYDAFLKWVTQGHGRQVDFVKAHAGTPTEPSPNLRQRRPAATTTSTTSPKKTEPPSTRPFTQDQVEGISRIKKYKAKGDLYAILGLKKGASDSEIKKGYRKVRCFHRALRVLSRF